MAAKTVTRTYAIMEVEKSTYEEVKRLLEEAGYDQAIQEDSRHGTVLDMHGIALTLKPPPPLPQRCDKCGYMMDRHCKVHMEPCCPGKCVSDPNVRKDLGL